MTLFGVHVVLLHPDGLGDPGGGGNRGRGSYVLRKGIVYVKTSKDGRRTGLWTHT